MTARNPDKCSPESKPYKEKKPGFEKMKTNKTNTHKSKKPVSGVMTATI